MTSNLQARVFAVFESATKVGQRLKSLPKLSMPYEIHVYGSDYTDKFFALNQAKLYLCDSFFCPNCVEREVENGIAQLECAVRGANVHADLRTRDSQSLSKSQEVKTKSNNNSNL